MARTPSPPRFQQPFIEHALTAARRQFGDPTATQTFPGQRVAEFNPTQENALNAFSRLGGSGFNRQVLNQALQTGNLATNATNPGLNPTLGVGAALTPQSAQTLTNVQQQGTAPVDFSSTIQQGQDRIGAPNFTPVQQAPSSQFSQFNPLPTLSGVAGGAELPGQVGGAPELPSTPGQVGQQQLPGQIARDALPGQFSQSPFALPGQQQVGQTALESTAQNVDPTGTIQRLQNANVGVNVQDPGVDPTGAINRASGGQMNAFINQVVRNALATNSQDFLENVLPALGNSSSLAGGFGGSRQGVAEGLAVDRLQRNNLNTAGQLLSSAFESDANRQLQGAQLGQQGIRDAQNFGLQQAQLGQADLNRQLNAAQLGVGAQQGAGQLQRAGEQLGVQQRGQDIQGNLTARGQDAQTAVTQRGQDINATLGQRQQDIGQRAGDVNALLGFRGQDVAQRQQDVSARAGDINAQLTGRQQDIGQRGQDIQGLLQSMGLQLNAAQTGGQLGLQGDQLELQRQQQNNDLQNLLAGFNLQGANFGLDQAQAQAQAQLTGQGQAAQAALPGLDLLQSGFGQGLDAALRNQALLPQTQELQTFGASNALLAGTAAQEQEQRVLDAEQAGFSEARELQRRGVLDFAQTVGLAPPSGGAVPGNAGGVASAASGALAGITAGSTFGPWGAVAGGVLGAIGGLLG